MAAQEEELWTLVENLPDNLVRWDRSARYRYIKPAHEKILGRPSAEVLGKTIGEAFPDGRFSPVEQAIARVIATGQAQEFVRQPVLIEGIARIHEVNLVPERNASGDIVGVLGIGHDVTDRIRLEESLSSRERELQSLADSSPGMMGSFYQRPDGSMCMPYVSPNIVELFGVRPEDVREDASALLAKNHPGDVQRVIDAIAESARTMTPWRVEYRIVHPSRGERWMEGCTNPEPHPDGGIVWYGYVHDITERKRMETALSTSEERYRTLAENSPDTIIRYDRQFRRLYVNRLPCPFLKKTADEIIGSTPADFSVLVPEQVEKLMETLRKVIDDRGPAQLDLSLTDESGVAHDYNMLLAPEFDSHGQVATILTITRDITTIRDNQRQIDRFLGTLPGFVYTARKSRDGALSLPYASQGIESTYGLSLKDLRHGIEPMIAMVHPEDLPAVRAAYAKSIAGMAPFEVEFRVQRPGKPDRWIECRAVPEPDTDGSLVWHGIMLDIEARKSAQRHRDLLEYALSRSSDAIYLIDDDFRFVYVNDSAYKSLGYTKEEMLTMSVMDIDPDITREAVLDHIANTPDGTPSFFESRHRRLDGTLFPVEISSTYFLHDGKKMSLAVVRDVSERKLLEKAIADREREFRTLIENSPDTIARYDQDCRRIFVNPAMAAQVEGGGVAMLGTKPAELPGCQQFATYEEKIKEVFTTGQALEFESTWRDKEGREICNLIRLTPECDATDRVTSVLEVGRDITELNQHRKQVLEMACFDSLTGLPNRALFHDRIDLMLTNLSRDGYSAGVMILDLDRFKTVNDTLGHPAGDELLCLVTTRLVQNLGVDDTVARLGGDEFGILLPEIQIRDDLCTVATKILEAFREPFLLGGRELFVSGSLGVAVCPSDGTDADELVKQADSAMYAAKRSGGNQFKFCSKELSVAALEQLTLEGDLRRAMERGELELHFQPQISLSDGLLIGSEALLRWNHPRYGWIPPDKFIPIAEDSGLMIDLGEWVLRKACQAARDWNIGGDRIHRVAVNLSVRQLRARDMNVLSRILEETSCMGKWIELEVTESLLLDETREVLEALENLRSLGVTVAIDDFGTGYSALGYLSRFPLDTLKIDRSFVNRLNEQGKHLVLVKGIVSIALGLGLHVVAEGVESEEQAILLESLGCHVAQGYWYGKPMPRASFEDFAATYTAKPLFANHFSI